jgi:hypothetical protein
MRVRRLVPGILCAVVAAIGAGCGFNFNPQSLVANRMIIGMKAEPPEVIAYYPPGSTSPIPALTSSSVTLSALVVDPNDMGQAVPFVWRACSETLSEFLGANGDWNAYEQRCNEDSLSLLPGGTGSLPLVAYSCDVAAASIAPGVVCPDPILTMAPFDTLLNLATDGQGLSALSGPSDGGSGNSGAEAALGAIQGAFEGAGTTTPAFSIWVDTMLRVDNGSNPALYGINRVVVSPDAPPQPGAMTECGLKRCPNKNPELTGLLFDYVPWDPGTPMSIKLGSCAKDKMVTVPNGKGGTAQVCQHTITPVFDPSQDENYVVQTYNQDKDGNFETLSLTEFLRFQWSIDQGTLDNSGTEQPTDVGPNAYDPVSTHWSEPAAPTKSGLNLWVVTTDGRGGTSWDHRQLTFQN